MITIWLKLFGFSYLFIFYVVMDVQEGTIPISYKKSHSSFKMLLFKDPSIIGEVRRGRISIGGVEH